MPLNHYQHIAIQSHQNHMRLDTNQGTHQGEIHLRDRVVSSMAAGDVRVSSVGAPRRGPNIFCLKSIIL